MADILKILLIIIGNLLIYVSYWLLAEALFPKLVESASRHYRHPFKITFLGLGAALLPVILGIALSKTANPLFKFLGISLLVIPGMLGLAGLLQDTPQSSDADSMIRDEMSVPTVVMRE